MSEATADEIEKHKAIVADLQGVLEAKCIPVLEAVDAVTELLGIVLLNVFDDRSAITDKLLELTDALEEFVDANWAHVMAQRSQLRHTQKSSH